MSSFNCGNEYKPSLEIEFVNNRQFDLKKKLYTQIIMYFSDKGVFTLTADIPFE